MSRSDSDSVQWEVRRTLKEVPILSAKKELEWEQRVGQCGRSCFGTLKSCPFEHIDRWFFMGPGMLFYLGFVHFDDWQFVVFKRRLWSKGRPFVRFLI